MLRKMSFMMAAIVVHASLAFAQMPATGTMPALDPNDENAPRVTVLEPVKDYGTIPKGDKLDWAFVVKNSGKSDLQIISATPGCGCTVADFDKVIKPGQTGKVTAHVDTTNFAGPIAKQVTVNTNDPSNPTTVLTIHAVVKPYVEAYPRGYVRYNILKGQPGTDTVTLYSEEDEPFQIVKIESPEDWIKVDAKKIDNPKELAPGVGRSGQNQYKLNIQILPNAKVGPLTERVHVITNSKHQPDYYVTVSGVVRPAYRVDPAAVNFGEVTPVDTAATRVITVHSNDSSHMDHFAVKKVESSTPAVVADFKPSQAPGDYDVTLRIAKSAMPGDIKGDVKIYTTDPGTPVVSVGLGGTVKGTSSKSTSSSSK